MATVTAFIRTSTKKAEKVNVRFRLRDGRKVQLFYKSSIEVTPSNWDAKKQEIKAKILFDDTGRKDFNKSVSDMKSTMLEVYTSIKQRDDLSSDLLELEVNRKINPEKYGMKSPETFTEIFNSFIENRKISEVRKKNYRVVVRALRRFELYKKLSDKKFELTFGDLNVNVLKQFERFLTAEVELFKKHPEIYKAVPETRPPKPRGQNTLNSIFSKLRTFILWAIDEEMTDNNPFRKFNVETCIYGTPYYLTIDERNQLYNSDLSEWPELAIQRDVFIFQCMIGCRVGDLIKMTKKNVMKGAIEYVPRKTREGRPVTVRVPLNKTAREILDRYKDYDCPGLLPFNYTQKYNDLIKEMFTHAGITRLVTVINPTTREEEKRPLNEIASSHLARRTFVGNLYKQVKDPNLVGALSGHKEGSRAFARYRDIDEQMKTDLVKLLE